MQFNGDKVICEGIIADIWAMPLKEFFENLAPAKVSVDLSACKDMHTAIAQLFIAYNGVYGIEYNFSKENYAYKLLLQGAKVT